jgi:hypothetical protein
MISYLLFSVSFFNIWIFINGNEQFHIGIINHQTQWYFHCPRNHTYIQNPPSNDQPLISYNCPSHSPSSFEILPVEVDFTFLCRSSSRLVWIIIDLYQFSTNFWLIDNKNVDIKVELNHQIQVNTSKIESKNFTNRYIIINAFYIPFESIEILFNNEIEINIQIRNIHQLNQCQFLLKDNYLWKKFLDQNCHDDQSTTFSIQYARCDFYPNPQGQDQSIESSSLPDYNLILSIKEDPPIKTTLPYYQRYLLLEEHYRQILIALSRSTHYSTLLKLTLIFLIIILLILILFFLYMLCYHHHNRSRSSISI